MPTLPSSRTAWVSAALLSCVASCSHPNGLPPPPDQSAGQKAAWQLAPEDAMGGVVIGDLGQFLDRMRAFKALLDTGPATRAWLQKGTARAIVALGFDPLDAEGWKRAGVDPNGPVGFFAGEHDRMQLVFRATDGQKAHDTAQGWLARSGSAVQLDCGAAGALYRCGDGANAWAPASDATHSLWARMEKDLTSEVRSMGVLGYAPLDVGPAQVALHASANKFRAAWLGLTFAPERFILRAGFRGDNATRAGDLFKPRQGKSLLGLGAGAYSVWRGTFSPDRLWALAQKQLGPQLEQGTQLALAVTGIDIEKALVNNLTGEVLVVNYRAPKLGPDGKPRPLGDRTGAAVVIGTMDDQETRKLADRLGELGSGALARFSSEVKQAGMDAAYDKEAGDRPVHWFTVTPSGIFDPTKPNEPQLSKIELFLTTIPGGLVIGEGRTTLPELKKRIGKRPSAFLDKLPRAEARAAFDHDWFSAWMSIGEPFAQKFDAMKQSPELAALLGPDGGPLLNELTQLGQLLYDATVSVDVKDDRVQMLYEVTFL